MMLFLIPVALFFQCKPAEKSSPELNLPADFETFFERFHSDSLYQIQHITFPLKGQRKTRGGELDMMLPVTWQQEDWVMHKPFNDHGGTFTRTYYPVGPVIIEKIQDQNQFFSMERRFVKIDGEWYLIYYGLDD